MVFLNLCWEAWGSSRVATGTSVTCSCCLREVRSISKLQEPCWNSLEYLPVNRAVSRVQSVNSAFLSGGDSDVGLPLKVQLGSQALSVVEAWNLAFFQSQIVKGVSGLLSSSGKELELFQEDQQVNQASYPVVRGSSVSHWSWFRGIRTYLELRGTLVPFLLAARATGFHSRFSK